MLPHTRQSRETMTSVSACHIILTPTQPEESGDRTQDLLTRSRALYRLSYCVDVYHLSSRGIVTIYSNTLHDLVCCMCTLRSLKHVWSKSILYMTYTWLIIRTILLGSPLRHLKGICVVYELFINIQFTAVVTINF